MSITGEPDRQPQKVGVAVTDVVTGLYGTIGVLAAVEQRHRTGKGQHIDMSLLDCATAMLANQAMNYLSSGKSPMRKGNDHPNISPYQVLPTQNGHIILAVGNDSQFERCATFFGLADLPKDPLFATNPARLKHREALDEALIPAVKSKTTAEIIQGLEALKVPAGPVQTLDQVFTSDQVAAREMQISMESAAGDVDLIGNPIKFSRTPVTYRKAPPVFGEDTDDVLSPDGGFLAGK